MQEYKSALNVINEIKSEKRGEKRRGDVAYSLEENRSGKITVKFTKEYTEPPLVVISTIVQEGPEFCVQTVLTNISTSDFTINLQNSSDKPVKGLIRWVMF